MDDIYIDCTPELSINSPKSITLIKSVQTSAFVRAVCHYKEVTYLGTDNHAVETIDSDFNIQTLASLGGNSVLYNISIHEERIYVQLSGEFWCTLNVYNLSGELITKWIRTDRCDSTRPAIVSNQIVVPDYEENQLTVYSLTGELIKHISCPQLNSAASACAVDKNSIIITNYETSAVFKVNISTEEAVWTCNDVAEPEAVAIYGKYYVCVGSKKKISFLGINTGLLHIYCYIILSYNCIPLMVIDSLCIS